MLTKKIEAFFNTKKMNDRLFEMVRQNGQFIRKDSKTSYLYSLAIGNFEGNDVTVEVSFKPGRQLTICKAFVRDSEEIA